MARLSVESLAGPALIVSIGMEPWTQKNPRFMAHVSVAHLSVESLAGPALIVAIGMEPWMQKNPRFLAHVSVG